MIDFRNINTIWASILATTFQRLGLKTAAICPGSRSTPLTIAFATHGKIEAIPILDERSAAFFALGLAKKSGIPTALICTSGTAAANFFPALIEAKESRVPLLILTADRPPELRHCHAGQAIDQIKLYGHYPNWQTELATPSIDIELLKYLRQTAMYAWEQTLLPTPGPVHLNIPFRDPLPPVPQLAGAELEKQFPPDFFEHCQEAGVKLQILGVTRKEPLISTLTTWRQCEKGMIIAGAAQPKSSQQYCTAIAKISQFLGWPILADGLSPLRNYAQLNPYLVSTYDVILRNPQLAETLTPKMVIQIGELPTSKQLRTWLENINPQRWVLDNSYQNFDPLQGKTTHLYLSVEQLATIINQLAASINTASSSFLKLWCQIEAQGRQRVDQAMATLDALIEPKAAWLLSQILPVGTSLFIANSMPVRDVEFFWGTNNLEIQPFFNRGANGIDGTLSTALGIAHQYQSTVMLTGDLALLHDTNGFLIRQQFVGHLTIILINNNGGGIFEMLPIAQFDPPFEDFFGTPQHINFAQLCATYKIEHDIIHSWQEFQEKLNSLPTTNIRVLELQTNRKRDASWRQEFFKNLAASLSPTENLQQIAHL